MAGGKVPLTFRLYKGDEFLREEKLTLPVIKVGKLSSSHLRLDDKNVSRMHALIEVTGPGDVSIIDLSSTTGTFVNGQKVNKAKLQSGDTVMIGETRIEVSIGGAEEEDDIPTRVQPQVTEAAEAVIASTPRPAAPPAAAAAMAAPPPTPMQAPMQAPPVPMAARPPVPMAQAPMAPAAAPAYGMYSAPQAAPTFGASGFMADQVDVPGARSVEVAAMLGGSVVTVKHAINPRGGKVTPTTWALLGIGAFALLIALIGFARGFNNASFNHAKKKEWVDVQKRPSWAFRPQKLGIENDVMMFAGLPIGLALIAAGLLRKREEQQSNPYFRIGQSPECEYPTTDAPAGAFPLVAPSSNPAEDFVFNFLPGMDGEMQSDGQSMSLADLQAQGRARPSTTAAGGLEVSIPQKARIRVKAGATTYLVTSVPQPKRQPVPLFAGLEAQVLAFFAGSAVLHFAFVFALGYIDPNQEGAPTDMSLSESSSSSAKTESVEDPPPPEPEETEETGDEESGGTGTAMIMEEGKMGKKDSDRAEGQYKMKRNADQEQLARTQALEQARTAGVLGSAVFQQGGTFASITGTGDISSGFDDMDIQGGLLGNEAGEMAGGFGFGRSGFGPGGGGTGWGTIGTGRFGTIGHGSGTGSGYGIGSGRGGMRGRQSAVPSVRIGQPQSVGDLDKAIIRRYIKRNIQKITYCYEKQLLASPGLEGTVNTQFFISPNGTVTTANASGVNGEVASCVASVIKGIEFPKPKGGGGVQVNYPFNFRPTGG
ncbi:MAG: AgmX/PglI C-terminal domain-containing protein [Kofleriaceae bacterium]|jgi:pSer/pThr/pTyr-binding forkhead associated (FHA) protein|nr:AgmX/PglI C-terminal domain-containing protein [Kofleriaceae bacterium]MBP9170120.1 AgmX/PglI C-terminal domain-containing protein [Kofleriaceae bacterium]MBP9859970.1 AgmX/PglI C-terminal domain-containing protein [Kofleriaceae bacterium]